MSSLVASPLIRRILLTDAVASLRLNGVNAKEHPVFKELSRVRQYFEKIKNIENPPPKPDQSLNKEAAIRFIRADLADNKEVNTKLSEMIAKERAKAAIKAAQLTQKRKAEAEPEEESDGGSEAGSDEEAEPEVTAKSEKQGKKDKKSRKDRKKQKAKKEKKKTAQ